MANEKIIDVVVDGEKPKFKDRVKTKASNLWNWTKENKEIVVPVATALIGGTFTLVGAVVKNRAVTKEQHMKDCCIYDRSKGHWVESKRKIKNKEWMEIDKRRDKGENYTEILDDMGLLNRKK